jgi:hypothetical protein
MRQPMTKARCIAWFFACFCLLAQLSVQGQAGADSLTRRLIGRWEVTAYSEQGIQVDKKSPALPQALRVYEHIRWERAASWYGYTPYEDLSRRENRAFEQWQQRDSSIEVGRIADAIALPYYAVFFADSTLALYNKDPRTNLVRLPESRRYIFSPNTMSIDISLPGGYAQQWQAQVLLLTDDRMTLFLPEEGEVVELVKTIFSMP